MLFDRSKPFTLDRVVRIGITAAFLWGLIWLLRHLSAVLIPFAVAFLLAYLINPLVRLVQKRVGRRVPSVLLTLTGLLLTLICALRMIVPLIAAEVGAMGRDLRRLAAGDWVAQANRLLPETVVERVREFAESGDWEAYFSGQDLLPMLEDAVRRVMPGVWGVISGAAGLLVGALGLTVFLLYLVFLLLDFERFREAWPDLLPERVRAPVREFVEDFNEHMKRYFRGQAMVAGIVGILFATGFGLIGLPLGILLGLLIGLLNMVPYLQIVGLVPAFVLALLHSVTNGDPWWQMMGLTLLVFVVIQSFQDVFLVPRIMGNVTGLSPAMILLSLSVWGRLLGIFGLLIALPMTCLLLTYYRRFLVPAPPVAPEHGRQRGGGPFRPERTEEKGTRA